MKTKRQRKKNPGAELVLMGANPTRLEKQKAARERASAIRGARLNNPLMNANFTQAQKMELGRLGISWTAIQTPADVRRAKKALADAKKIRNRFGNPMAGAAERSESREQAADIYSGFHAAEPKNILTLDEPHIPGGSYPELGLLIGIEFKPTAAAVDRYVRVFETPKENVHVIGALDRKKIYFAGGDQGMTREEARRLGWNGSDRDFELGEARKIIYLARKYHSAVQERARGELVEWVHEFGEETGEQPSLWYDTVAQRIFLRGGAYEIKDEGITN